jgi:membrane-associated protein
MSLSDYLLSTLGIYGLPVLFAAILIGAVGLPLPGALLLIAAGSFVEEGEMSLWPVILLSASGAVIGDNLGYMLGRWGGPRVKGWAARLIGGQERLRQAEDWLKRRQGAAIFLSRWLLTPLGPVVNFSAGLTSYSWRRFLLYGITGEIVWVVLYVLLGKFFSDRVQIVSDLLGDVVWMIVGLLFVVILGGNLWQFLRPSSKAEAADPQG